MHSTEMAVELMQTIGDISHTCYLKQVGGMGKGENFVLFYLHTHYGITTPSELSNTIGVSTARIAATLRSLENKNLIVRCVDQEDRRKIIVSITEIGKARVLQLKEEVLGSTVSLLEELGEKDAREFIRIVRRIGQINEKLFQVERKQKVRSK